jgi:hypothetical protein
MGEMKHRAMRFLVNVAHEYVGSSLPPSGASLIREFLLARIS